MFLLLLSLSFAASVTEDRRTYADQTVQERWTWQNEKTPHDLIRKEWFHSNGRRARLEEYRDGVLSGQVSTWTPEGLLETESNYLAGVLHGTTKMFDGLKGERWVYVHQNYREGQADGEQLLRDDAETVSLRHNYQQGKLHGVQRSWHPGGEMRYEMNFDDGRLHGEQRIWEARDLQPATYMRFKQGLPEGAQRYYSDSDWHEEDWTEGRWEGVRSWHTEGEIPESIHVYELEVLPLDRQHSGGKVSDIQPTRPLHLQVKKVLLSKRLFWPDGSPQEQWDQFGDQAFQRWAENGQRVLTGFGDPDRREGLWTEWRADGSLFKEEAWNEYRKGEIRTFDQRSRLREVETWDWDRKRWQLIVYEGEYKVAEGELHRMGLYRWGPWTYYREDGSTRRTEVYGSGPYSGNRSFVVESQSFRKDGSAHCSGDERDLLCVEPQADGGRVELKVRALHRPRHGIESYQTETFSFVPRDIERKALFEKAVVASVLDGEGLVRERRTFDSQGNELRLEQWSREGILEQISGAGPAGPWQETYNRQAQLITVTEALPEGETCTAVVEDGRVVSVVLQGSDGSSVVMGQGRDANRRVAACPFWSRHPELEATR